MSWLRKLRLIAFALFTATMLALVSSHVERIGPELAVYENMCGQSGSDFCYKPVLKGGFPMAYLFDMPGVSVERQLSFGEDTLSVGALILDIAIYFATVLLVFLAVSRRRSTRVQTVRPNKT